MKNRLMDDLCGVGFGALFAGIGGYLLGVEPTSIMLGGGILILLSVIGEFAFRYLWGQEYMTGEKEVEE